MAVYFEDETNTHAHISLYGLCLMDYFHNVVCELYQLRLSLFVCPF